MVGSFVFNDTATTEIYTLSLHDALPISDLESVRCHLQQSWCRQDVDVRPLQPPGQVAQVLSGRLAGGGHDDSVCPDLEIGKSTRLNSSHANISYAVFCLKKKTTVTHTRP